MLHDAAMMLAGAGLFLRPRNSSTSRTRAAPHVVPSSFGGRPCGTMPTLLFGERQSSIAAAPEHHNENEYGSLDNRARPLMRLRPRVRVVPHVAKPPPEGALRCPTTIRRLGLAQAGLPSLAKPTSRRSTMPDLMSTPASAC